MMDDAWTRYANVDNSFRFTNSVERTSHKWIVFDGIGKTHKLRARKTSLIARPLSSVFDNAANLTHRVHIDAGSSGRSVHRGTKSLRAGERCWNRIQEFSLR